MKKQKAEDYTNLRRVMNSSLQPFTINSTTITGSVYNQRLSPPRHNYCEACCCHLSRHPASKGDHGTAGADCVNRLLAGCCCVVGFLPAAGGVTSAPTVPVVHGGGGGGTAAGLITQDTKIFISGVRLLDVVFIYLWKRKQKKVQRYMQLYAI